MRSAKPSAGRCQWLLTFVSRSKLRS
jgi:hypothetical protein